MNALPRSLDDRLDAAGWGLFFIMSGVALLVPALPNGTWLACTGAIIVGAAALRANLGLRVDAFWTTLGGGLVVLGIGALAGLALPWFAVLTIACGLALVAGAVAARPSRS